MGRKIVAPVDAAEPHLVDGHSFRAGSFVRDIDRDFGAVALQLQRVGIGTDPRDRRDGHAVQDDGCAHPQVIVGAVAVPQVVQGRGREQGGVLPGQDLLERRLLLRTLFHSEREVHLAGIGDDQDGVLAVGGDQREILTARFVQRVMVKVLAADHPGLQDVGGIVVDPLELDEADGLDLRLLVGLGRDGFALQRSRGQGNRHGDRLTRRILRGIRREDFRRTSV